MSALEERVRRVAIDGVPVLWANGPEPFVGTLSFRVGRADETLATAGISHLVEHLALFTAGTRRFKVNGFVEETRTVFWASGTREEVSGFLTDVARAVANLPLERLEVEKRVLLTEAESWGGGGAPVNLMGLRFGAASYGLGDFRELGLHRLEREEVAAWSRQRFTSENAAVWLSGAPSDDLTLPLPRGERIPAPQLEPLPGLRLPAHLGRGSIGVSLAFVVARSVAGVAAMNIAAERMHERLRMAAGLTYSVVPDYRPLTAETAHVTLSADCLAEQAVSVRKGMLVVLDSLAADGPTDAELAHTVDSCRRGVEDPQAMLGFLDGAARDELLGTTILNRQELLAETERLTAADVCAVLADGLPSAIVLAPAGTPTPGIPYLDYDPSGPERPSGRTYRPSAKRRWSKVPVIVAGEDSASLVTPGEDDIVIPFAACVALLRADDGTVTLLHRDGSSIQFAPAWLNGGKRLVELVERQIPAQLVIPIESTDPTQTVAHLVHEQLGARTLVWREARMLPAELAPGERIHVLAEVERLFQRGLLAATSRRLIYVTSGFTGRRPHVLSYPYDTISQAEGRSSVSIVADGQKLRFRRISNRTRAKEIVALVRKRISESTAAA